MRTLKVGALVAVASSLLAGSAAGAQTTDPTGAAKTAVWCSDATTLCWAPTSKKFSGLRLVFEPQLGVLVQGGKNKFNSTNFKALEKLGVATPLYGKQLGLQLLFIYPSTIQFDEQSPVRLNNQIADEENGKVDVDWGLTLGLTAIDGVVSLGWGFLKYDRRDFKSTTPLSKNAFNDSFFYLNIQAIEAVKSALKGEK